jgi:hypothetical protein
MKLYQRTVDRYNAEIFLEIPVLQILVECPCLATGRHSLFFLVGLILLLIYFWHDILPLNDEASRFGAFLDELRTVDILLYAWLSQISNSVFPPIGNKFR